jgi:hypothetical protein
VQRVKIVVRALSSSIRWVFRGEALGLELSDKDAVWKRSEGKALQQQSLDMAEAGGEAGIRL